MTNFHNWGIASHIGPEDINVLKDLDVEYQLVAIQKLTQLHLRYKSELEEEIKRRELLALNCVGPNNDWEVEWHIEALYESTYVEGGLCLSFVGLTLPLLETLFVRFFRHLGGTWKDNMDISNARWQKLKGQDLWDCSKFVNLEMKIETDIRAGILQLCEYTGFSKYLDPDFSKMVTLLFKYRNNLFHNGMEWPLKKRQDFHRLLKELECDQLFTILTSGGEPWMFIMTDECLDRCQRLVKDVYYSMNKFCFDNNFL